MFDIQTKKQLTIFFLIINYILSLTIILGFIVAFASWSHSYKISSDNTQIADIYISAKTIRDNKPTFTIRYVPKDGTSAWWVVFNRNINAQNDDFSAVIVGDNIIVEGNFIKWSASFEVYKLQTMFKVSSIKSSFSQPEDGARFGVDELKLNSGNDYITDKLTSKKRKYKVLVDKAEKTGVIIDAKNEDRAYALFMRGGKLVVENR